MSEDMKIIVSIFGGIILIVLVVMGAIALKDNQWHDRGYKWIEPTMGHWVLKEQSN